MTSARYPYPVNAVLSYGFCPLCEGKHEPEFAPEHVPDLLRMVTDTALIELPWDRPEAHAPGHALFALCAMRAIEAVPQLLDAVGRLIELGHEGHAHTIAGNLGNFGVQAIPIFERFATDPTRDDEDREMALEAIHCAAPFEGREPEIEPATQALERLGSNPDLPPALQAIAKKHRRDLLEEREAIEAEVARVEAEFSDRR